MVDAHVSGACSERSAGSSPVPGTKKILQVVQNERKSKIFFLLYSNFGHLLATFLKKGMKKGCRLTPLTQGCNGPRLGCHHVGHRLQRGQSRLCRIGRGHRQRLGCRPDSQPGQGGVESPLCLHGISALAECSRHLAEGVRTAPERRQGYGRRH